MSKIQPIRIRELRSDDLEIIDFITHRLAERWAYSPEEISELYIRPALAGGFPFIYLAFTPDGRFAGKIFLNLEPKGYMGIQGQLWISALFVPEEFRNQGIARKLIRTAEEKAKSLGYSDLYLDTVSAAGYYAHIGGWEEIGKDIYERDGEKLTIMKKRLDP